MKKIISLFLAFVFVVGICASAPMTIKANAAEVTTLELAMEYTLPVGSYYFTPQYDGWYKFESSDGGDPVVYIELNEDDTDYYEDDDYGVDNNFRCFVELKTTDSVCVKISNYNEEDTTEITFQITYEGTDAPEYTDDVDNEGGYDDDGGYDDEGDSSALTENGFTASKLTDTTCEINAIGSVAINNGVLNIPETICGYTVTEVSDWLDCNNNSDVKVINIPDTLNSTGFYSRFYNLEAINASESNTLFKTINGVLYNKDVTLIEAIPSAFKGVLFIPKEVTNFDYSRINVEDFEIEDGNTAFSMRNGFLCNADGTVLKKATSKISTEFTLTENVIVEQYCFRGSKLEKLTVASDVTTITYSAFSGCENLKTVTIPSSVKTIQGNAFSYCGNLANVTLSEGLTAIGAAAFQCCYDIKNLNIPKSVAEIECYAFASAGLTSVTIPGNVKTIWDSTFVGCRYLETVVFEDGVEEIYDAFEDSAELKNIVIPDSVKRISANCFSKTAYYNDESNWENGVLYVSNYVLKAKGSISGAYTVKQGTKGFADFAFSGCESLTEVIIPDSVKFIPYSAFQYCTSLKTVVIGNGVTDIIEEAFYGCNALENLTVGNGLKNINSWAFADCSSLESVVLPNSLVSIDEYAFTRCTSLRDVVIPNSLENMGTGAFSECPALKNISQNTSFDDKVSISTSVTKISYRGFYGCTSIKSVVIPENVKEIDGLAFYGCEQLSSISIHDGVTKIGGAAFTGTAYFNNESNWNNGGLYLGKYLIAAKPSVPSAYVVKDGTRVIAGSVFEGRALTSVVIPDSVVTIGDFAFSDCTNLTSVTISDNVTSIGRKAFETNSANKEVDQETGVEFYYVGNHLVDISNYSSDSYKTLKIKDGTKCIATGVLNGLSQVETLIIPSSVTSINADNLSWWAELKSVVFDGSENQWKKVIVGENNDALFNANITFTHEHNFLNATITKQPTCTETGVKTSTCACGDVKTEVIPAKGHTEVGLEAKPATCTATGLTAGKKCTVCGVTTVAQQTVSALGHDFSAEFTVDKEATVTEEGSKSRHCTRCDAKTDVTVIEKLAPPLATPVAKTANTAKGIKVTWNKIANAEKYVVYQRTYNAKTKKWSGWKALKTTTGLSYVDTTTKLGTIYRYTVKAVNGKNTSGIKSTGNIKFDVKPTVTVANASNGIKVSWSTVANATGYTVYSSTYNSKTKKWSSWKNRGTAKANAKSWVDKSAKKGTIYKYTVRARYGSAASSFVASANIVRLLNPTVKAVKASNGVKVTWNKIAGAKNYKIYRATYANGKWSGWSAIKTTNNKTFAYVDKTAKKGVYYKYTVRAVNGKSASSFTASKNVKR